MDELQELERIRQEGLERLAEANDAASLEAWRVAYLGRNAPVMQVFSRLGQAPRELRPQIGQSANAVKQALEAAYQEKLEAVRRAALEEELTRQKLDVTLPGRRPFLGRYHIETQTMREILRIFTSMGFQVYSSPDIETDEYNFTYLNIPPHHPARDMWDTFYLTTPGLLLRTHTSPGQIHAMRQFAPEPVRVVLPGMCYRYEQAGARKDIQFTQVELLAVGYDITFADLKGTLQDFADRIFGERLRTRLRPSYFPFTEPSAEMDVECVICHGKGCSVCKGSGWLEIMGCGMVHPVVLQHGGYDPAKFTGFAAGMGPGRIAMLRHAIQDIRSLYENDVRFLEQF
ncbi:MULTISPECIES: phenylalanine--tRNA ligase subunit alpha [Anaerolinea]|uniref:phenylalanine--tRNA ligase subunit alpha n=1 Tax=Anaerolinea TaxID=233189 RepID=UPI0026227650|nr:phenylalanine--tRNA ligase subunit alpha [Anaerolinea thermophila]